MKRKFAVLSLLFLGVCSLALSGQVLRLAENQPENGPVTIADYHFAELVKEASKGELVVEVYAGAILGQENDTIQQMRGGVIEMVRVNSVPIAELVDEVGVVTLPYVFASTEHQLEVVSGEIGDELAKAVEKVGMKLIAWFNAGSRCFYTTKKPIKTVADMKGMKIRVQPAKISMKMIEVMGGIPTPMNHSEVYSALQTGIIDGAENDYATYYTSSQHEVAKFYSEDGHLMSPAVILMNLAKFNALSPELQKVLLDCGREAMHFEFKIMTDFNNEAKEAVMKAGTQVFSVDVSEFQKAVEPMYAEYPQYKDILARIRALQ